MRANVRNVIHHFIVCFKLDRLIGFLGRHQIAQTLVQKLAPPVSHYQKDDERLISTHQLQFLVQMNDLMSQPIYFGLYINELLCLKNYFPLNAVVIDVGANVGRWSLFISQFFKTQKIYAFEPYPETFLKLQKNINLNKDRDIEIYSLALNSKNEKIKMTSLNSFNSGMNHIVSSKDHNDLTNDSITLDHFLEQHQLKKISVVKIDVEGFELNVLLGAEKTLTQDQPLIICEIDDQLLGSNMTTPLHIFQFLWNLNYTIKKLPNFELITPDQNFNQIHFDIMAFPPSQKQRGPNEKI